MAAEEPRHRSSARRAAFLQLRLHLCGGAVAKRGRPEKDDEQALYWMHQLIEDEGVSEREAARIIAFRLRHTPGSTVARMERLRKKYARRREEGKLPTQEPISHLHRHVIQKKYRHAAETAEEAMRVTKECAAQAKEHGLDLDAITEDMVEDWGVEKHKHDELLTGPNEAADRFFARRMTEQEAYKKLQSAKARSAELETKIAIWNKHKWAQKILDECGWLLAQDLGKK